jgi:tetratricopeptide (TPR) repeat protein
VISSNTLGRYQIVREIARSNDIVYEARDPVMGRRVALKELAVPANLQGAARRDRIERFYREAKAAGSLTHPHIVTIYEVGEDNGRHFIAMEYLEGQSLRDTLQVRGALPVSEALRIAIAIAQALQYAHQHGVIHRDVKPDNVHLLPDGGIKLTDFGIARLMFEASLTADGQIFGTPSYMSPEQVSGKGLDPRSDLFSLGVMLYEMVTGRKPFTGDSVVTITYNIMHMDLAAPPGVPPAVQTILRRAMSKDPAARYPDAAAMIRDLQAALTPGARVTAAAGLSAPGATQVVAPGAPRPLPNAQRPADPFANLRPDDLLLPQRPHAWRPHLPRPRLGPAARAWIGVMLVALVAAALVLCGIWGLMVGYEHYQSTANRQAALTHFNTAAKAFDRHDYALATAEFLKAARISPGSDVGRVARRNAVNASLAAGYARQDRGDSAGAEQAFLGTLRIDPSNAQAHASLALLLYNRGQHNPAFAYWDRALLLWHEQLTRGELDGEATREAREQLARAEQNYATALYNHAQSLSEQRRNGEAIPVWQRVIQVAPGSQVAVMAQDRLNTVGSAGMGIFPSTMGANP